jgi:hypothetical protein
VNLALVQILCFWTLSIVLSLCRFSLASVNIFFNDIVIFIEVESLLSCDVRTANYIYFTMPCFFYFLAV